MDPRETPSGRPRRRAPKGHIQPPPLPERHARRGTGRGAPAPSERGGLHGFGDVLRGYLRASGLEQQFRDLPVFDAWSEALGEGMARRARPVRFRAGELTVEVDSAAHRQELASFSGERFRRLANQRLGREAIERVHYKLKR